MNGPADHARGWLAKADSDLIDARRALADDGPYDTACFHAQQAIEKSLKAVLAYFGEPIPHIHDLEKLAERVLAVARGLDVDPDELSELTPYAIELRYDLSFWPNRETAKQAIAVAERVRRQVSDVLPPEARP